MKLLVAVKRVIDYNVKPRVKPDGTGVDLASEESGIVPDPRQQPWAPVDLANRAFGQGVNVTLVQLARAFSALVNGGYLVTPHVSMESDPELASPPRVLPPKVARQTREILEYVTGAVPWYAEGAAWLVARQQSEIGHGEEGDMHAVAGDPVRLRPQPRQREAAHLAAGVGAPVAEGAFIGAAAVDLPGDADRPAGPLGAQPGHQRFEIRGVVDPGRCEGPRVG